MSLLESITVIPITSLTFSQSKEMFGISVAQMTLTVLAKYYFNTREVQALTQLKGCLRGSVIFNRVKTAFIDGAGLQIL